MSESEVYDSHTTQLARPYTAAGQVASKDVKGA